MTTSRPEPHYCRVCRYALDLHVVDGVRSYQHTHASAHVPAHESVPVPLVEFTRVNQVCDFCSAQRPALDYRFEPVVTQTQVGDRTLTEDWGEWWSVCTLCAPLIDAGSTELLLIRATHHWAGAEREGIKAYLRPTYVRLLSHVIEHRAAEPPLDLGV